MTNKSGKRGIAQDDIDLFRREMAGATRYARDARDAHDARDTRDTRDTRDAHDARDAGHARDARGKRDARHAPDAPAQKPAVKAARPAAPSAKRARGGAWIDRTEGDYVEVALSGLQPRVMRKLKRGEYRIGNSLDLHGRTVAEAEKELPQFLRAAAANGASMALIIPGKGQHSGGRGGVMKRFVVEWLKGRGEVKAFCSAAGRDGGTGAVYVLLRAGRG